MKIMHEETIYNLHFSIIVLQKQIALSDEDILSWNNELDVKTQRNMWKKSIAKKEKILKNLKKGCE